MGITGNIAGGHIHRPAERDPEMGEIPADPLTLLQGINGGGLLIGGAAAIGDVIVDPIADAGGERMAVLKVAEEIERLLAEAVRASI